MAKKCPDCLLLLPLDFLLVLPLATAKGLWEASPSNHLPGDRACGQRRCKESLVEIFETKGNAGVQPQLIQGIRRRDGIGEGQETTV